MVQRIHSHIIDGKFYTRIAQGDGTHVIVGIHGEHRMQGVVEKRDRRNWVYINEDEKMLGSRKTMAEAITALVRGES